MQAKNWISEAQAMAEFWIQTPFDPEKVNIQVPKLIAVQQISEADELGAGWWY